MSRQVTFRNSSVALAKEERDAMEKMYKIGVNAILIQNKKVLLGKRLGKIGYGEWGFPGGHLELGENFIEGVKRELLEETGLIAESIDFLQLVNDPRQEDHFIHINFLVKKWSGELENREPTKCEEWKWFDLDNLPVNIFFGHSKFLPAYLNKVNFIS